MSDLFGAEPTMKAISLWQPWASLIAVGAKHHETRHWSTEHRGPIAIHAAKTVDTAGAPDALCLRALGEWWQKSCPIGAIVAIGDLTSVHRAETVAGRTSRPDLAAGNFTMGRYAWRIDNVRALDRPIPCVGRQGIFNWTPPGDLAQRLGPAVDHFAVCRQLGFQEPVEA